LLPYLRIPNTYQRVSGEGSFDNCTEAKEIHYICTRIPDEGLARMHEVTHYEHTLSTAPIFNRHGSLRVALACLCPSLPREGRTDVAQP